MTADLRDQLQATLGSSYTLERELGGGGMSRVFVAEERALGRKVVVKVLSPELAAGVSAERFAREMRLAASLQQANIVPVLAAGVAGAREAGGWLPFYTMPFVEGQSLRARLQRDGALPVAEAVSILKDVARALAYAHEHGVVHRDIKPENVLLSGGAGVVTDFGIAKAITAARTDGDRPAPTLTQVGTSVGTPAYVAPEQAAADPDADHRVDIYSFGVMAYELLAGQPPFHGRTSQRLLAAHMAERPEPIGERRPDTPPALAELVMRCLEKEPAARPQSAAEVLHALDAVTSGGAHAAAPAIALASRRALGRALALYGLAFVAIALLARAAIVAIGLPEWVFPGALVVMALGLPAILVTAVVHYQARMAHTVPTTAPGGVPVRRSTLTNFALKARPHVTWRRTALGGAYALGAFTLLVAGFMLLRSLGIGPAGSLLAARKLKEREPLLVADFRTTGADSALGGVVAEAVRTELSQSPVVSLMPTSAIVDALGRMRLPPTTRLDQPLGRELAQREGVRALVSGDVTPLGKGYVVTMRLVAAESGDELASFQETADEPKDLIGTIDRLSRRLRGKIGESLKTVHRSPPLERVTTASLTALRKYAEGSRASDAGDYERAIPPLEEAVALDTAFAMAYRKLGVALENAGILHERAESVLVRAYRHRDRLPERERYHTIAQYSAIVELDRQKEVAAYEALLERYPDDVIALHNLALAFETRRQFAAAESLYRWSNTAPHQRPISYAGIARTQTNQGKFSEAAATLDEGLRRFPRASVLAWIRSRLLYNWGREDSGVTALHALQRDRSQYYRAAAAYDLADLAMLHGRLGSWAATRLQAHAADEARGAPAAPLLDSLLSARADIWFREGSTRGTRLLDSALAREPPPVLQSPAPSGPQGSLQQPYLEAALTYALARAPERARALLARYDAGVRDSALRRFFEPRRHDALAEIALAEGRPLDAAQEFRLADVRPDGPVNACAICLYVRLGRAYDLAEMPDSAIAMFERYLATPFFARLRQDAWFLAGVLKRLGELYEARGDRSRAAAYYARFVELWKDADPELQPKVADVRRRLARLRGTER